MSNTNSNNINWGTSLFLAASLGTTMLNTGTAEVETHKTPSAETSEVYKIGAQKWEKELLNSYYKLSDNYSYNFENFVSKLVNESHNMDEDIQEVVNKHFWDMI